MLVYGIRHLVLTPKEIRRANEVLRIAEIYDLDVNIEALDHEDSTMYLTGREVDEEDALLTCKLNNIDVYREDND